VAGQRVTARERIGGTALLDRVLGVAVRLPVRRVAAANGVVIALLGVLGVLAVVSGSPFGIFDLDGERNIPATYTAEVLFSVAVLALLVGRIDPAPGLPQLWVALSAFFVFVSADEFGEIHERLERITGIDWQILYSPIAVLALVLWLFAARRLRESGRASGSWWWERRVASLRRWRKPSSTARATSGSRRSTSSWCSRSSSRWSRRFSSASRC
jgi:hypothetical protein